MCNGTDARTCTRTHTSVHKNTRTHKQTHTHVYTQTHISMHTHTDTQTNTYITVPTADERGRCVHVRGEGVKMRVSECSWGSLALFVYLSLSFSLSLSLSFSLSPPFSVFSPSHTYTNIQTHTLSKTTHRHTLHSGKRFFTESTLLLWLNLTIYTRDSTIVIEIKMCLVHACGQTLHLFFPYWMKN